MGFKSLRKKKTKILTLVIVALCLFGFSTASASAVQDDESPSLSGNEKLPVIIVLKNQPEEFNLQKGQKQTIEQFKTIAKKNQSQIVKYLKTKKRLGKASNIESLWLRNAIAVEAAPEVIKEVANYTRVEKIIYDKKIYPLRNSNSAFNPLLKKLKDSGNLSLKPQGFTESSVGENVWNVEYIGADDVQERGITGEGVNVSVVDTGIDADHPALEGQLVLWNDFSSDNFSTPRDPIGHGTHVSGTIAGKPNAKKAVGVAPGANLFVAKIFNKSGVGRISDAIEAFEWSVNNSADVISASIGIAPIPHFYNGEKTVYTNQTLSYKFKIYQNPSEFVNGTSISVKGFKPSYVYIYLEPETINGSEITEEKRAQVMNNTEVKLVNSTGSQPLKKFEAGWWFSSGEVPDEIGLWKYKPQQSRPIESGNWTLKVTNNFEENVTYEFSAVPIYPSNGSDELSKSLGNLAEVSDVIPVVAAGNSGFLGNRSIASPGASEDVITVGAQEYKKMDVTKWSGRGPVGFNQSTRHGIDIIAPGEHVLSAIPANNATEEPYAYHSGTSMATPHVSGTVALLLEANPDMSLEQARSILKSTANQLPKWERERNAVGAGALNAWKAVNSTCNLSERGVKTEKGIKQLFAGIGNTSRGNVYTSLSPLKDAADTESAPDLWAANRILQDEFELATYNKVPNATFSIYLDTDMNDSTGDQSEDGSEYKVEINRTLIDEVYQLRFKTFEYNSSQGVYQPTSDLDVGSPGDVYGDFLEFHEFGFKDRDNEKPFEWHVVSSSLDGTGKDRMPDESQATYPPQKTIEGVAVAWNATAGKPDVSQPITFQLFEEYNNEINNDTVLTDEEGMARTEFNVSIYDDWTDYTLEINDSYGNKISQSYHVDDACVECLVDHPEGIGNYSIDRPWYSVPRNTTHQINIPIYQDQGDDGIEPYKGNASLKLETYDKSVVRDNLKVEDGILRAEFDFDKLKIDEDGWVDIEVALESNFSGASQHAYAGGIDFIDYPYADTNLYPETAVIGPRENASLTFQNSIWNEPSSREAKEPLNVSADYRVLWVKDTQVASLFTELSPSTVNKIKGLRKEAYSNKDLGYKLSQHDIKQVKEAIRNLTETEGFSIEIKKGIAHPFEKGVGQFNTSPPEEPILGLVEAKPNTSTLKTDVTTGSDATLIFVDNRVGSYLRKPEVPEEEQNYYLDLYGYWPSHTEGGYQVPNDTFEVQVGIYDEANNTYIGGEKVNLYTTAGNMTTVTTNSTGIVTVKLPAPQMDWPNSSYYERRQQVLAIAKDFQTAKGKALSQIETLYGWVYKIEEPKEPKDGKTVEAHPHLFYGKAIPGGSRVVLNESFEQPYYSKLRVYMDDTEDNDIIYYNYSFVLWNGSTNYTVSGRSNSTEEDIRDIISYDRDNNGVNDKFREAYIYAYSQDDDTLEVMVEGYCNGSWEVLYGHGPKRKLGLHLRYLNESWEPTNATTTLIQLKTPDLWGAIRDVNVSFVKPPSEKSEVTYTFDEEVPPQEMRSYEVKTKTGYGWGEYDWEDVHGATVNVDLPEEIVAGKTVNVTLKALDREQKPIEGSVIIWSYKDIFGYLYNKTQLSSETFIGVTDEHGETSLTLKIPEKEKNYEGRRLCYRTGLATDNVSYAKTGYGCTPIVSPAKLEACAGPDRTVRIGESLNFDGSCSTGNITSYKWSFGDGANATGKVVTHSYSEPGEYTVTLTVTNSTGATDSDTAKVDVLPLKPVPSFTSTPSSPEVGERVMFNASSSYDPDGYITNYSWSFGDGSNETGMIVNHSYTTSGSYTVKLTVKDNQSLKNSTTRTVTVTEEKVKVYIGDGSAAKDNTTSVPLMIRNVSDLGSAKVNLTYDESVVNVTNVSNSDFDQPPNLNTRGPGWVLLKAGQYASGLSGDVKMCNVTLKAVGDEGDQTPLNLTNVSLEDMDMNPIPVEVINGTFTIRDETPPLVLNASAKPHYIANDGTMESQLRVEAVDHETSVESVKVNLSSIGYGIRSMTQIDDNVWVTTVNSTVEGVHHLNVNVTDAAANSNTSECIELVVIQPPTVSIGDGATVPDENTTVTLEISNISDNAGVGAITANLTFNKSIVNVTRVSSSDFDFSRLADRGPGWVLLKAGQRTEGLSGTVRVCDVTLRALGAMGQSSALNLTDVSLEDMEMNPIPCRLQNGTFQVGEVEPPAFTNLSVNPSVIPADSDGKPTWGETAQLNVTVSDESNLSVKVNLSPIGGSVTQMNEFGGNWSLVTNATVPGTHNLTVNATDEYGNSNTTNVTLKVLKNGDVYPYNGNGKVDFMHDALYLVRHTLNVPGYGDIRRNVADVAKSHGKVNFMHDALYLVRHTLNVPGYEVLH